MYLKHVGIGMTVLIKEFENVQPINSYVPTKSLICQNNIVLHCFVKIQFWKRHGNPDGSSNNDSNIFIILFRNHISITVITLKIINRITDFITVLK